MASIPTHTYQYIIITQIKPGRDERRMTTDDDFNFGALPACLGFCGVELVWRLGSKEAVATERAYFAPAGVAMLIGAR